MPQKTWAVGEEVLAADFNSFLQQQVVATFPNTVTRDLWAAPPIGALCVTTDTLTFWIYSGSAWGIVSGLSQVQQAAIATGIATAAAVELTLATINIPAKPAAYTLECSAFWHAYNGGNDTGAARVRVNGTQVARQDIRSPGNNMRVAWGIATTQLTAIPANTAAVVTATLQNQAAPASIWTMEATQQSYVTARIRF